jgi:GNAT superfamily N-acetyltransferase
MTLTVRPLLNEAELDIADTVVVAAFKAPRSRKAELQKLLHLQPDGWMLALLDNEPVGFGGLTNYGNFAYLGMMSVLPSAQGKGVGKELMRQLVRWAEERECPAILLDATETGSYLYKQFGFVEENRSAQWRRDGTAEIVFPQADCSLTEVRACDLPTLAAFDVPYFGAERGGVFAEMLNRHPQRAFVTRDESNQVSGYLFAQESSIGPWVACTVKEAECLLARALTLPFERSVISINISVANSEGIMLLERYGFSHHHTLTHMRRGKVVDRDLRKVYGQASFALG